MLLLKINDKNNITLSIPHDTLGLFVISDANTEGITPVIWFFMNSIIVKS